MPGGAFTAIGGTTDITRIEAPVTVKAYLICAFAAFGGICESSAPSSLPLPPSLPSRSR